MVAVPTPVLKEAERRFIVGRVLEFTPVMGVLLALFATWQSKYVWLFAAKYALLFVFIAWLAQKQFRRMKSHFHDRSSLIPARAIFLDSASSNLIPLIGAAATVGFAWSVIKKDWRWLIVVAALCFLLLLGLALRWFVYDRWLKRQASALELAPEAG